MKISSPSRKTRARNPSHFGSKIQLSPSGNSLTRLASIGRIGAFTSRSIPNGTCRYQFKPSGSENRALRAIFHRYYFVNLQNANLVFWHSVKLQYFTEELIFTTLFSEFFTSKILYTLLL